MLTGEAVPVRKVSYSPGVDGPRYDPDLHKACTLYGGTTVAQVRPPGGGGGGEERQALGVVCRTAFWTAKGALIRSILYPGPGPGGGGEGRLLGLHQHSVLRPPPPS